jgi:hypothetical protein
MTKPQSKYSELTIKIPEKLIDKRASGKKYQDLLPEERVFDLEEVKHEFVENILNFRAYSSKPSVIPSTSNVCSFFSSMYELLNLFMAESSIIAI